MPVDRRPARRASLVAQLEPRELAGVLISGRANVRYLTGFSGSAGVAFVTASDVVLVTDFRYDAQARAEVGDAARVEIDRTSVWERLTRVVTATGATGALGFEAHVLTAREAERLAQSGEGRPWRWVPVPEVVEPLRARKAPEEVGAIRAAAEVAETALAAVLPRVRPGQRELEVAGMLEHELRCRGSEAHPFPVIVAAGERSALPHARAGARPIARGELLLLDLGATVDGYCADITRTVVVDAAPTAAQRELYDVVWEAQRRARLGVQAGMTGREADALARDVIVARGFGEAFGHSTGHGLGLEVHEAPRLAHSNAEPLPAEAVVTVEPGVYVAGQGGVRLEDDVHLSAAGPVLLSAGAGDLASVP